jgi:NAD+ diphosphatase
MPLIKYCPFCGKMLSTRVVEGKTYTACSDPSCSYVHWDNPLVVVAALVEYGEKVIFARNKAWPENMFGLITGFLEKNESPEQAVLREVKEELGLGGTIKELIGLYSFFQKNQLIIAYAIEASGDIITGEELAEVKIVEPERIKPWAFGTGPAVSDWLKKHNSGRTI